MSEQSDVMVAMTKRHADLILRASGSALRHHTVESTRKAILSAVLDLYEEAYRAGAKFADDRKAAHIERIEALNAVYRQTLEEIAAEAFVPLSDLPDAGPPNGWRDVAVERINIARAALSKAKRS